ncbi:MAG: cell division protein ZapA [Nitrospiria bacterium]
MKNKIHVEIFGHRYTLKGDADEAYVKELASFVDQKMNEMAAHTPENPLSKLAILTAINIAHEFFQLKARQKEHDAVVGEKTQDLIENIEEQFEALKLEEPPYT